MVFVFGASDFFVQKGALVAPFMKFEFVNYSFLLDVLVCVDVFLDFVDGDLLLFFAFVLRLT